MLIKNLAQMKMDKLSAVSMLPSVLTARRSKVYRSLIFARSIGPQSVPHASRPVSKVCILVALNATQYM